MLKTVIYARYSSDKQNEQSIEGQIHECEQFAKTHDMVIIKHYIDRALSGKTDDRPSFLQMIKDSSSGLFDAVLVYKTDRFARNRYDSAVYKAKLKKNGIKIFYAKENIPDGPEGIILESMLEGFAEYYSAELSQKVKRGIKENIRKGLSFGGACPFGYKIVNKKYVIDDEQAPYVKKIFEDYAKGRRAIDIFNELNTLPNYAGKGRKWNRSSLNRMLTNKKYIGIYELEDVCVKDAIPPIIDEALFNKVQSRILFNRRHTTRAKVNYLLSGKLFCGLCEHSMTGKTGTSKTKAKYHYYVCSHRHCKQKKYRKELLEDIIIQYTVKDILNPKHFKMIAKKCLEIQQADNKINDILLMLKKQLTATKTKINNLMNAIEAGIITTSTKDRLEQLEQEKYKLELEISTQQLNSNRLLSEKQIIYMLNVFYNKRVDVSFYNQIIDCFIYKIYIYSDKICIVYNLNNSDKDVTYSDINELYKSSHLNSCGSPSIIILDEAWVFLDNEAFSQKIREWLKVLRKMNVSVIFATQSLVDVTNSNIFHTVLDACQSKIFLANPTAIEEANKKLYKSFGLNDRQIQIIAQAIATRDYYYTSVKGSRLYDLSLGKFALAYVGINKADQNKCDEILKNYPREEFNDEWQKYKGVDNYDFT